MFITYLINPHLHTNTAGSWPGIGNTKVEAEKNAKYWSNQKPWVRTVPASRAPRWAQREARSTKFLYLDSVFQYGYTPDGQLARLTDEEEAELMQMVDSGRFN